MSSHELVKKLKTYKLNKQELNFIQDLVDQNKTILNTRCKRRHVVAIWTKLFCIQNFNNISQSIKLHLPAYLMVTTNEEVTNLLQIISLTIDCDLRLTHSACDDIIHSGDFGLSIKYFNSIDIAYKYYKLPTDSDRCANIPNPVVEAPYGYAAGKYDIYLPLRPYNSYLYNVCNYEPETYARLVEVLRLYKEFICVAKTNTIVNCAI